MGHRTPNNKASHPGLEQRAFNWMGQVSRLIAHRSILIVHHYCAVWPSYANVLSFWWCGLLICSFQSLVITTGNLLKRFQDDFSRGFYKLHDIVSGYTRGRSLLPSLYDSWWQHWTTQMKTSHSVLSPLETLPGLPPLPHHAETFNSDSQWRKYLWRALFQSQEPHTKFLQTRLKHQHCIFYFLSCRFKLQNINSQQSKTFGTKRQHQAHVCRGTNSPPRWRNAVCQCSNNSSSVLSNASSRVFLKSCHL